jgi:hypothetical protein
MVGVAVGAGVVGTVVGATVGAGVGVAVAVGWKLSRQLTHPAAISEAIIMNRIKAYFLIVSSLTLEPFRLIDGLRLNTFFSPYGFEFLIIEELRQKYE